MSENSSHVAKIRFSSAFLADSFRAIEIAKGIKCVLGRLKGNKRLSAKDFYFDSAQFSVADCRSWLLKKSIQFVRIESAAILEDQRDIISNQLEEGEFQLFIRGTIGFDVSGVAIAEEIDRLNEEGAKKIILRINSAGGDVIDGFNIVSSILRSEATIETINEGVAASMAAVILASGDQRRAFDFSTALIHDPMLGGTSLEEIKDEQKRDNLIKIKNGLVKILKDSTGQPEKIINELMTRETVMSATEQRKFGLVNSVIKSRVKKAPANLSLLEVMNYSEAATAPDFENYQLTNPYKMNKLTNFLNLQNDADEESVLKAIQAIKKETDDLKGTLQGVQDELAQDKADLKAANEKLESSKAQNVKLAVDGAIESGKFAEDQRDTLTAKAEQNLEFFSEMIEAIPLPHSSALEAIQKAAISGDASYKNEKGETVKKDWDWFQQNDPTALQNLQHSNPKEYDKLYTEYWGKEEPASK